MKKVIIIGIGMGSSKTMTLEGVEAVIGANFIIGAKRMVEAFLEKKEVYGEKGFDFAITPVDIEKSIRKNCLDNDTVVVLMSGDTGFYSGTKKLIELLKAENKDEYDVKVIPGISSLQYFCAKIMVNWDDVYLGSLHGREGSAVSKVYDNKKVFYLLGKDRGPKEVCRELVEAGLGNIKVYIGEKLSYPEERILEGRAEDFIYEEFDGLSVILIHNENLCPWNQVVMGIEDDFFMRDKVPMTKEEVRTVSISKMALKKDGVIYDVGAGTGSISCEMALIAKEAQVFAIETNPMGVELIKENAKKLGLQNLKVVSGMAPEALMELPAPDKVFIGGSKGNMEEIIRVLLEKNPRVRIVMNAIALESLAEILRVIEALNLKTVDICQIATTKTKKVAKYTMMQGLNPVFIVTAEGRGSENE